MEVEFVVEVDFVWKRSLCGSRVCVEKEFVEVEFLRKGSL